MVNLRHRLEQEKANATAAGRLHSFDSARPWDDVWAVAQRETSWWHREVEVPASENAVNLASDGWIAKPQQNSFAPSLHTEAVMRGNVISAFASKVLVAYVRDRPSVVQMVLDALSGAGAIKQGLLREVQ
eukprot:5650955-Amphidinium_carterae.1